MTNQPLPSFPVVWSQVQDHEKRIAALEAAIKSVWSGTSPLKHPLHCCQECGEFRGHGHVCKPANTAAVIAPLAPLVEAKVSCPCGMPGEEHLCEAKALTVAELKASAGHICGARCAAIEAAANKVRPPIDVEIAYDAIDDIRNALDLSKPATPNLPATSYDERSGRIYYQDIVYHVCSCIDRMEGGKGNIVCGTYQTPSLAVQEWMSAIANRRQKAPNLPENPDSSLTAGKAKRILVRAKMGNACGTYHGLKDCINDIIEIAAEPDPETPKPSPDILKAAQTLCDLLIGESDIHILAARSELLRAMEAEKKVGSFFMTIRLGK